MKKVITALFLFYIFSQSPTVLAQFSVDDTKNALELVNLLTNNSPCILVSNPQLSGDTFTPGKNSSGQFTNTSTAFPFSGGILLSTWSATNAVGWNVPLQRGGGSSSWTGDNDLDAALSIRSINATVLEFDFISLTTRINFNYLFASNEYQSYYPCVYSDGFAFLIKEVGSTEPYKNLALLPGTTTVVSSTQIRTTTQPVGENLGCPAKNETFFNGFNSSSSPINFAGQVIPLKAQATLEIGKKYHIKLVIADDSTGDEIFDSAIFLEAGSFSPQLNIGPDRTIANSNPVCFGENQVIETNLPPIYQFTWYKNGTIIPGATQPKLTVTDAGTYKVEVLLTPSTCTISDEIVLDYAPQINVTNSNLFQCDDNSDGLTVFNLTKAENILKNNNSNLKVVGFYESLTAAQGKINAIVNTTNYANKTVNQVLFARIENVFGCPNFAQLSLNIANNLIPIQNPVETCDLDDKQDGFYQFDLNVQVTPQLLTSLPLGLMVEYYSNANDAVLQNNPLPTIFKNTVAFNQTIYSRIVNGPDCYGIVPIPLIVNVFDPTNFQQETTYLCTGSTKLLEVDSGFLTYLWSTGQTTNSITVTIPGKYTVEVTNSKGCKKTKTFSVTESGIANITAVKTIDFSGSQNSIEVVFTGIGTYEFSIDGKTYQESPVFINVAPNEYEVTARDKNNCGISAPFLVYILDYPRYFTPNNDGFNDLWAVKNLFTKPNTTIYIFDRYGKLLKELNENSLGWNGTFNSINLPADDYWFQIIYADGKTYKSHFSLKR